MRYGIFSDVHSNLEALEAVIDAYKEENIDKYLCVGDVVGYAANPNECAERIKALAMITVSGNHDQASVNLLSLEYFNPQAAEAIIWAKDNLSEESKYFLEPLKLVYKNEDLTPTPESPALQSGDEWLSGSEFRPSETSVGTHTEKKPRDLSRGVFTLVHGTLDDPQDFNYMTDDYAASKTFKLLETNVCFVGHTHHAEIFIRDKNNRIHYSNEKSVDINKENKYIINVGSVGQPRDGNPNSAYCIYDADKKKVELKRVSYDIQVTAKKIYDAGLPKFLGDRLRIGR